MWLSYIKVAFRSLIKQRLYAFINISGLAIGVTTCILILMYVRYEQSYDTLNPQASQIHRLGLAGKLGDNAFRMTNSTAPAGQAMLEEYPEVINYARIRNTGFPVLRYEDKVFSEEQWWQADSSIFEVFNIPVIAGDPATALTQPFTVVITDKMARKYFGDENPIGKVFNSDNQSDWTVTAVVAEMPRNSHWHFDFLGAMGSYGDSRNPMWLSNNFQTYLLLQEGADPEELRAKFPDLIKRNVGPELQQYMGITIDEFLDRGDAYEFLLTPLLDIHLYSNLQGEIEVNGDGRTVKIFGFIAIFILLLASINYMNLSTARSMSRAREIGIRKTLGSNRSQIIVQFLAESIFVTFLAFSLALILVKFILPWFSGLIDTPLSLDAADIPWIYLWVIPVGLLAGSYPAFLLSSFNPLRVLKGKPSAGKGGNWLRNGLVIFQFTVSITLLIGTLVVKDQLDYMQTKDLGLNPNNLLVVNKTDDIGRSIQGFKAALRDDPGSILVSNSTAIPGNQDGLNGNATIMVVNDEEVVRLLAQFAVDYDYAAVFELEMAEGRFFSRDWGTDTMAVVINQAAVKAYGVKDPVGKNILSFQRDSDRVPIKIIGVVKDYHFEAPQLEIRPMAMFLLPDVPMQDRPQWGKFVTVKVDHDQMNATLAHIEKTWKQYAGDQALEYDHFDEMYQGLFRSEQAAANIIMMFAALAIFIACLGLLGLAAYTAERRTKEIGIRKVLGASVANILVMLSRDTLKMVVISILIAVPISYYAMQEWLANFAYRVDVSLFIFLAASVLAVVIAIHNHHEFSQDIRPSGNTVELWKIQVSADQQTESVELDFHLSGALEPDHVITILDIQRRSWATLDEATSLPNLTIYPGYHTRYEILSGPAGDVYQALEARLSQLPERNLLAENYPNPFNASTRIPFSLQTPGQVRIEVFDIRGRQIKVVVNQTMEPGHYNLEWNGLDKHQKQVASGIYFYRLILIPVNGSNPYQKTKKMVMVR